MRKQITLELDEEGLRLLRDALAQHNQAHNQMLQRCRNRVERMTLDQKPVKEINLVHARVCDIERKRRKLDEIELQLPTRIDPIKLAGGLPTHRVDTIPQYDNDFSIPRV